VFRLPGLSPRCSGIYVCVSQAFCHLCVCLISVPTSVFVSQDFRFLCLSFPSVPTLCVPPKCSDFSIFHPSVRLICVCLLSVPTSICVSQVFQLLCLYFPSIPTSMCVSSKCSKFYVCVSQVFQLLCLCLQVFRLHCLPLKCSKFYVCLPIFRHL
jgi:hypothetical protein